MNPEEFIGGTLVEYTYGYGWTKEWARGPIVRFTVNNKKNSWLILTEGATTYMQFDAKFAKFLGNGHLEDFRNDIYYLNGGAYCNICFCFAKKGVEIPVL